MSKIYETLKIEVEGGQYAKPVMISKLDYAWSINKITEVEHVELTGLVETCADPNYIPVKTLEEKLAELEVELLDAKACIADLTDMLFVHDDQIFVLEEKVEENHPTQRGAK